MVPQGGPTFDRALRITRTAACLVVHEKGMRPFERIPSRLADDMLRSANRSGRVDARRVARDRNTAAARCGVGRHGVGAGDHTGGCVSRHGGVDARSVARHRNRAGAGLVGRDRRIHAGDHTGSRIGRHGGIDTGIIARHGTLLTDSGVPAGGAGIICAEATPPMRARAEMVRASVFIGKSDLGNRRLVCHRADMNFATKRRESRSWFQTCASFLRGHQWRPITFRRKAFEWVSGQRHSGRFCYRCVMDVWQAGKTHDDANA